jgi:hypothetical protein
MLFVITCVAVQVEKADVSHDVPCLPPPSFVP